MNIDHIAKQLTQSVARDVEASIGLNHTLRTRSALIRSAEARLRRDRYRQSAQIFGVSAFVIVVFLIAAFVGQVLA